MSALDVKFVKVSSGGLPADASSNPGTLYFLVASQEIYLGSTKVANVSSGASGVTGVKGNEESSYRDGNVNLTPANIGAVDLTSNQSIAGTKTFSDPVQRSVGSSSASVLRVLGTSDVSLGYLWATMASTNGVERQDRWAFYQNSYNSTTGARLDNKQVGYRLPANIPDLSETVSYDILTTKDPVSIDQGGTGATTVADAIAALGAMDLSSAQTATGLKTFSGGISLKDGRGIVLGSTTDIMAEAEALTDTGIRFFYTAGDTYTGSYPSGWTSSALYGIGIAIRRTDAYRFAILIPNSSSSDALQIGINNTNTTHGWRGWRAVAKLSDLEGTLSIAKGGTSATTASAARANLEAVGLSGNETIAGQKTFSSAIYKSVSANSHVFDVINQDSDVVAGIYVYGGNTGSKFHGRLEFMNYSWSSSTGAKLTTYEEFLLPNPGADLASSGTYNILTTKAAVTVAQGGTGATTAAAALTNLGAAASTHTHSQYYSSETSRTKNTVLAAPNGSNGTASFRALVAADLPDSVVLTSDDQTIGGTKTFTSSIYSKKTSSSSALLIKNGDGTTIGSLYSTITATNSINHQAAMSLRNYSYNSSTGALLSYYESFATPTVTAGLSSNSSYTILTTKNPNDIWNAANTILTSKQYGTSLPANSNATAGRLFFKKL